MKKKTAKKKGWIVMDEKTEKKPEGIFLTRWEADEAAKDVCFMGSCGLPQKVVPCTITYSLQSKKNI